MIRPLNEKDDYDLDNVCLLRVLTKGDITQAELKRLYGDEIKGYAQANGMLAPVEEHNRCWRLQYADEVGFHLDTLPCVPEDRRGRAPVGRGRRVARLGATRDRDHRPQAPAIPRALSGVDE